ncbi:MAG: efflux RND transporter periplasmic adaptor subunit [Sterolibacterium sp.]|nr:efflux RND transporter periplasmic adaptor subunit [Sterolibacterium sp.]
MARPTFLNKRILLISLLGLTLAGCGGEGQQGPAGSKGPAGPGGAAAPEVMVIQPLQGSAAITQDLPGRLQAVRTAQVRARVEGIVEKRLFTEGSDVKQGQTLFQIDDRSYKATATSAMVDVEVMKAALKRYEPLLPSKAVSQQEYDQAQVKLMQTQAAYTKARIDLENTQVPASISGRIGRALVTEGALVGRGEPTHLATIEQVDPIYANFTQSNAELLRLRKAMQAGKLQQTDQAQLELVLEDGSVYPLPGKLAFSDLAVETETGAVNLRALFPNPKHELLPGQYVRVRFKQGQLDNVLRVPQAAVMASEQGQLVMVVNAENKVEPRPIETAGMSGPDWLVSAGLQGNEKIIIKGLHRARPGSVVQPVSQDATPAGVAADSDSTPANSAKK